MTLRTATFLLLFTLLFKIALANAAYNLEVPVDPWEEYRQQFKSYSQHLLKSYDRAFVNDYEGALREASKAIEILPDEGLGYAERAYYQRMMNMHVAADKDFRTSLALFEKALERYKPTKKTKTVKHKLRTLNPISAARLSATTHYQRGEVYFRFEQYQAALTDFSIACQGGESIACSKMWETKTIEKRGINWVPVANRQFYDKMRVDTTTIPGVVRVWIRREDTAVSQAENALESALQQHLELRCNSKDFKILDYFSTQTQDSSLKDTLEDTYQKPIPGTAVSKLLYLYCKNTIRK